MEVLVPAFLLAVLTQLGERPATLTAVLADRYGRPLLVALAAGLGHGVGNLVSALVGASMAHILTPEARTLLLAVALVLAGVGGVWPVKPPKRHEDWKIGPFFTPFLGVFALAFGDRTQFFTLALAARELPWFAAAGATLGSFAVGFVAAVMGEPGWKRLPLARVRVAAALLFLVAGVWLGIVALRLT